MLIQCKNDKNVNRHSNIHLLFNYYQIIYKCSAYIQCKRDKKVCNIL